MRMVIFGLMVAIGLFFSSGCGQGGTRKGLIEKAKPARTQEELIKVLGQPVKISKKSASDPASGGGEMVWMTYKGSDGDVTFFFHYGIKQSAMYDTDKN